MTVDDLGADEPLGEVPPVSAELDLVAEGLAAGGPMVGIAIRLPVATLDAARLIAHDEGVKVTAMLREWIDQRVADTVEHVELLLTRFEWDDATRECDRLTRLFPTHPEARRLTGER